MNSDSIKLSWQDPQNVIHDLKLVAAALAKGFYFFRSNQSPVHLLIHGSEIEITHNGVTCRSPGILDAMLAAQAAVGDTVAEPLWHSWRQMGPTLGRQLLVRKRHTFTETLTTTIHSASDIDSLIQRGWTEWRYM